MERKCDGSGSLPAQLPSSMAEPSRWTETIDLLMCAASAGSASVTQTLIDRGACQASFARRSQDKKGGVWDFCTRPGLNRLLQSGSLSSLKSCSNHKDERSCERNLVE